MIITKNCRQEDTGPIFDTFLEYNGVQINVLQEATQSKVDGVYKADGH